MTLPSDSEGNPIQAMSLRRDGSHVVAFEAAGAESIRNTVPFHRDTLICSMYCTAPCWMAFGDENVEVTAENGHYFPQGIYYDFAVSNRANFKYTHVAIVAVSTAGVAYLSEKL